MRKSSHCGFISPWILFDVYLPEEVDRNTDKIKAELKRGRLWWKVPLLLQTTQRLIFFSSLQFRYLQSLVIHKGFRGCKDKTLWGLFPVHQHPSYYVLLARHTQLFHKASHCSFILKCWNDKSLLRHGKEHLWKWGWRQAPYCRKGKEHISPDKERKSAWKIQRP